jgi:preprotein translocase subunit SecG
MGVKKTGDLLERLSWIFITVIILVSLGTNVVSPNQQNNDDILDRVRTQKPAIPATSPIAPSDSAK